MKNIFTEEREIKMPKMWQAMISLLGLIAVMVIGIVVFGAEPHIPLFLGVIIAAIVAISLGYKWSDIEGMMIDGISKAMQSVLIICVVGMMIGAWVLSGTIPTMIYYGLQLLSPSIFLIATVLICSIVSLATGTSWGTMGTMGVALVGIGAGLGMPIGPTAGAVISGAYFGDKLSPLSDTTNLAPAMAGTDVFTHIKYMLKSTIIAYVITLVFFGVYGFMHSTSAELDASQATVIMEGIKANFNVNPVLLLPAVIVIVAIALKIPALPGITLGFIVGLIMAPIFQDGVTISSMFDSALNGYVCETDVDMLNELLSTGGLMNMSNTVIMVLIAMMYGGVMEGTRQLEVIINGLAKIVKSAAGLVLATEITCVLTNAVCAEQYISILLPGRMFAPAYREKGLHPKTLSNVLESAGTVTSCLIPWNTCGLFIKDTLHISTGVYAPWAVFNYTMPIVCFVLAIFGVTIAKMTAEEQAKADAGELV